MVAVKDGRAAAKELCDPEGPRIALLDWIMPELDGPAVCRQVRLRRGQRHIHLVLLTSKNSKQDVVEGLESGADDYLTKPFDPEELKARLHTGQRILQLEDSLLEAREEMRYKATHDSLTSLLNRGTIMELLARELVRTRREKRCTLVVTPMDTRWGMKCFVRLRGGCWHRSALMTSLDVMAEKSFSWC